MYKYGAASQLAVKGLEEEGGKKSQWQGAPRTSSRRPASKILFPRMEGIIYPPSSPFASDGNSRASVVGKKRRKRKGEKAPLHQQ